MLKNIAILKYRKESLFFRTTSQIEQLEKLSYIICIKRCIDIVYGVRKLRDFYKIR